VRYEKAGWGEGTGKSSVGAESRVWVGSYSQETPLSMPPRPPPRPPRDILVVGGALGGEVF
jgi:hypothetical protein